MTTQQENANSSSLITGLSEFTERLDYSLINTLKSDPQAKEDGIDHRPRQVFSGHYVPVTPTPIPEPEYVAHSYTLFKALGLDDKLAHEKDFLKVFSGDLSEVCNPMKKYGWATGYALSIYGNEYTSQCPFRTGNGYGDGRAISIFEGVFKGKRWEMQLKGGGPTPYCRGADGRAVLRSSVREFLAQEFMHALGVPTSRSLTLYLSRSETVARPWYRDGSNSNDPDIMVDNPVAISTRVAPSFLRVGQIELFARRTRNGSHPEALEELEMIVDHLIKREYQSEIDQSIPFEKQVLELARLFRGRLTRLVANWLRVGYCQGNFNSDNCAAGGFTLDYGPFGFCEVFDPEFQPWTGGGRHFAFFNQPRAAENNFHMFWSALRTLLGENSNELEALDQIRQGFAQQMQAELEKGWSQKLGLKEFDLELFQSLGSLMVLTRVDYTIFFRELSRFPSNISGLKKSFYTQSSSELDQKWDQWVENWRNLVLQQNSEDAESVSKKMKMVNPKYTWREWLIVPAYKKAAEGDFTLIEEIQHVLERPYEEQSPEIEDKYYRLKPQEFFNAGGVSHYSCSS